MAVGCNGDDGSGSGEVVAHISGKGPVATPDQRKPTDYPLQGATWEQGAEETDLLIGRLVVDAPPNCPGDPPMTESPRTFAVQLFVDGEELDRVYAGSSQAAFGEASAAPGGGGEVSVDFQSSLFKTGSEAERTLTARFIDQPLFGDCPRRTWTLKELEIEVIAFE